MICHCSIPTLVHDVCVLHEAGPTKGVASLGLKHNKQTTLPQPNTYYYSYSYYYYSIPCYSYRIIDINLRK